MAVEAHMSAKRRPSMEDVARKAGVSKAAVSKVIRDAYGVSPSMRVRVEAAISELGYRPRLAARAMRGSSFSIGLEIPNLGNEFFTQIMEGATAELAGSQFQLVIAPGVGEFSGTRVLENLADRQVDGMIAVSPEVTPEWLEGLAREVPVVLIARHDDSQNYDTVTNDDEEGTRLAFEHLRELHHGRITHLTTEMTLDDSAARAPHTVRLTTYHSLMTGAGLDPVVAFCGPSEDEAYERTRNLLESDPGVTAIFAGNDTLAIGALRAVADLGFGAKDVSIVGYDDIRIASHPLVSLTTVTQFGERMGGMAVDLLLSRIRSGRTAPEHPEIQPELRIRSSTHTARDA